MSIKSSLFATVAIFAALAANVHGQPIVIFVNASANGSNDGSSWEDAYTDLHDALGAAADAGGHGVQMWVAAGEYVPGPPDEDPQSAFEFVSGVEMYGGFAGWETELDQRDWEKNKAILRRDVPGAVDVGAPIVRGVNLEAGSRLDGFVVADGWNWMPGSAGGLLLIDSHFDVANCVFQNNININPGAGIAAFGSAMTLMTSRFVSNVVPADNGAALYSENTHLVVYGSLFVQNHAGGGPAMTTVESKARIEHSTFIQNEAIFSSGAIHATGTLDMIRCAFIDNISEGAAIAGIGLWAIDDSLFDNNAGAVQVFGGEVVQIHGTHFTGNTSSSDGGAIYSQALHLEIDECFFYDNSSTHTGGALRSLSYAVIRNSRLIGNRANGNSGGGIYADGSLILVNCEVTDNSAAQHSPAGGIRTKGELHLINTLVARNYPGGVLLAQKSSAYITNSTVAHNALFLFSQNAGLWIHPTSSAEVRNSVLWGHGPAGDTCAGSCGGSATGCWCDENCCDFHDCCVDKFEVCGGCVPAPYTDDEIVSHQIKGPANVSHSIIHGLTPGSIYDIPGANNSGDDPLFIDPHPLPGEEADFRLQPGSPAIDSGNSDYVPDGIETDLDGNPRIVDGSGDGEAIVDMGPYEFQPDTPTKPGDLNGDGVVNVEDLLILLAAWGPCADCPPLPGNCPADLTGNCAVGVPDLLILLANWG